MKTTFDLPAELVRAMKMRAARDGQKLKDVAAKALRAGLAGSDASDHQAVVVVKDKKTGLPVIQCRRPAKGEELTPQRLAEILAAQEAGWANGAG